MGNRPPRNWIGKQMKEFHLNEDKDKEAEEQSNVIPFQPMTGQATAGQGPPTDNWLDKIAVGSIFLITSRGETDPLVASVIEIELKRKTNIHAYVTFHTPAHSYPMWYKTEVFSRLFRLEEVVRLPEPIGEPIEEEVKKD